MTLPFQPPRICARRVGANQLVRWSLYVVWLTRALSAMGPCRSVGVAAEAAG